MEGQVGPASLKFDYREALGENQHFCSGDVAYDNLG